MGTSAVADPLVGRYVDQRYRIEQRIARGGMATVYLATDLRLDRRVALKVVPNSLSDDADFAQRFVREARAAARLTDPGVVAVYDQGADDGLLFLAMEFVDGGRTLRDLIRESAPLPPRQALAITEDIVRALAAAHESGIIHRDVKPENVLIGPRGEIKVADFGLARAISSETSATATGGVLMGTVAYLPPELVVDGTADARSDVYSVGVVLFELLTGIKPHDGDSPIQVAYKHVHCDVPPPSRFAPGIPPYVDALVARATSRSRDLRPSDAYVLLQQLRRVRLAVDSGVTVDEELTDDLTPTVAVAAAAPAHAQMAASVDEVFDQDAFGAEAATMIVGSPALRPPPTAHSDGRGTDPLPDFAAGPPPRGPNSSAVRPQPPRRRRRRLGGWIALLVVIALAVSAGFGGWYYGVGRYQNTPDVVGLTQQAAAKAMGDDGLTLSVTSAAFSETIPDGHLISTDPGPGDHVTKGGTVTAVISKGPERHDVPDLSTMTEQQATAAIARNSLTLAKPVRRRWSDDVPEGGVISFTPKAGVPLHRGGIVHLVVSRGPQPIDIPDYQGKLAANARTGLTKLGFVVHPSYAYNDEVAAGVVIRQTPHDGVGFHNDAIGLVISKGPHLVKVPSVNHQGVTAAETALDAAGFHVEVKQYTPSFGLGIVVAQSPHADEMAPYGSTITIYIV